MSAQAARLAEPDRERGQVVGFIDVGTNSVRLMLVRLQTDHSYAVISLQREAVRLGEREFKSKRLQPEAMERALLVCGSFASLARSYGAKDIVAVATSATREASNRLEFLRRLRDGAGLDVHAISGKEEARLVYLGVLSCVDLGDRTALAIDIGGGSTEVIVGTAQGDLFMDSLSLGALRLRDELVGVSEGGVVPDAVRSGLQRRVELSSAHAVQELRRFRIDVAYGTSGTIRNLAAAAARMFHDAAPGRDQPLARADLRKLLAALAGMTNAERARVPGINPERADIIVAGGVILESLMTAAGVKEIVALADCGVREGLLVDYLQRIGHTGLVDGISVRERSVLQLAHAVMFDEVHARRVRSLALGLFDSSREAGLHVLGERERDLLGHAALLHDIGSFISYRDHHLHSAYLAANADLLGFDQDEVSVIAAVIRFHRKTMPTSRHQALAGMRRRDRESVPVLSLLLRLAEGMDRSRAACVAAARLVADGATTAVLEVETTGDCHLELWAVERQRDAFRRALGRTLVVQAAHP
jgi:exopolyphosphatase / guanosine-5'-triphosphate,3'-diphosphate pyrophosphatase